MGTTTEKLTYLQGTKDAIKNAIVAKGVEVPEGTTFRGYAEKVGEIKSGGGVIKGIIRMNTTGSITISYIDETDMPKMVKEQGNINAQKGSVVVVNHNVRMGGVYIPAEAMGKAECIYPSISTAGASGSTCAFRVLEEGFILEVSGGV